MMLRQLEYLVALARERHFGRAAAACNVSQPTLSAAIRALEEELGAPIVERGHKFHGMTAQGRAAVEHAHRILAEAGALKRSLEEMDRGLSGRLKVGAIPTALPIIAHITAPFYERFPKVLVTILSLNSHQIQQGIDEFELDVGFTYLDNEPLQNVRAKPIYVERYMFLTSSTGPFARRRAISWKEASAAPLCLLTPDMQNRRIIDGIFRAADAAPEPVMETNSIFNLCSHVASGLWSSIVPVQLLQFFGVPHRTRAIDLVEPSAQRTIGLIMAAREPPSPLARNLFAMELPADIGRLILPPLRAAEEGFG
jgi:DNA-binding transcriptional LysR family regulator